jgi:hypothetical protein
LDLDLTLQSKGACADAETEWRFTGRTLLCKPDKPFISGFRDLTKEVNPFNLMQPVHDRPKPPALVYYKLEADIEDSDVTYFSDLPNLEDQKSTSRYNLSDILDTIPDKSGLVTECKPDNKSGLVTELIPDKKSGFIKDDSAEREIKSSAEMEVCRMYNVYSANTDMNTEHLFFDVNREINTIHTVSLCVDIEEQYNIYRESVDGSVDSKLRTLYCNAFNVDICYLVNFINKHQSIVTVSEDMLMNKKYITHSELVTSLHNNIVNVLGIDDDIFIRTIVRMFACNVSYEDEALFADKVRTVYQPKAFFNIYINDTRDLMNINYPSLDVESEFITSVMDDVFFNTNTRNMYNRFTVSNGVIVFRNGSICSVEELNINVGDIFLTHNRWDICSQEEYVLFHACNYILVSNGLCPIKNIDSFHNELYIFRKDRSINNVVL